MSSFNLVDQGWIPCVPLDGRTAVSLSLRDVFGRATDVREIVHASPLVVVAITRTLLAILHRNFGPGSLEDWLALWNRGDWDTDKLNEYLDTWHDWFDLFHPEKPFYQVPYMTGAKRNPVTTLAQELSSGNNATLFDHRSDEAPARFSPEIAAQYILARQAFAVGGGVSKPFNLSDSTLARGFSIQVGGRNLYESLMLNLVQYNKDNPLPHDGDDTPSWERDSLPNPDRQGTLPLGYLDYLTWQSRRIHLIPEGDQPVVRWCQIQQNLKPAGDFLDPYKCFRREKKAGFIPMRLSAKKAVWRDSTALFQDTDSSDTVTRRPQVIYFIGWQMVIQVVIAPYQGGWFVKSIIQQATNDIMFGWLHILRPVVYMADYSRRVLKVNAYDLTTT